MKDIQELRKLNDYETSIILNALQNLAERKGHLFSEGAKILLEDDAEFVRGLFWTSKTF